MSNQISEYRLRQEVVRVTNLMVEHGLSRSNDGNISVRLGAGRFLVTPSRMHKKSIQPDDLVIVDGEGKLLQAARAELTPTSELGLHLEVYRQRSDVNAVLHAHPPYATALTICGIPYPTEYLPEVLIALGPVPTAPYARPGTEAMGASIRALIRTHNNILLSHHGSVSAAHSLEKALLDVERMEQAAYTYYLARTLGTPRPLPAEELAELAKIDYWQIEATGVDAE